MTRPVALLSLLLASCIVVPQQPTPAPPQPTGTPEPSPPQPQAEPNACAALLHSEACTTCGTPAERAEVLNSEGKSLWLQSNDLDGAIVKFGQAFGLSGVAKHGFNLCYSLHQADKLECSLWACEATLAANPDESLKQRVNLVIDDLNKRLPASP